MKKLLIWDGDNTLWDGIIMEGTDRPISNERIDLCKELASRGVLQSVASRNLYEPVMNKLTEAGLDSYFLAIQADLKAPKSHMVGTIVNQLGLTKYSDVVFVDDDRFNLEEVRSNYSEVFCYEPISIKSIVEIYFTKPEYTDEDRNRVRRYKEEQQREQAAKAYTGDYQEFLHGCNIQLTINKPTSLDAPRLQDLFNRANQMSVVSPQLTELVLIDRMSKGEVFVARVEDRFGDYGLSGFVVFDSLSQSNARARNLEALVVSCRLQGKGIGSAMLGWAINDSLACKFEHLVSTYIPTDYNQGMKGLYEWYQFDYLGHTRTPKYILDVWSLPLTELVSLPPWVRVHVS